MKNEILPNLANKESYARADVVAYYENLEPLFETEKILFEKLFPKIENSKILDIGIGGGRTTKHLLQITANYIGVDYVAEFAEKTAKKYPDAKILCGDARNLVEFADQTFDFVLFSYNGIDAVTNEDRLKILKEINRVLKPEGIFMFSSHNRDYQYFKKLPWHQQIKINLDYFIFVLHCLYHLPTHFRMKKHEIDTDSYAIVNDGDHRFSMLLYYINIENQAKQLTESGFFEVESYDFEGKLVKSDSLSQWIYYLAKKV